MSSTASAAPNPAPYRSRQRRRPCSFRKSRYKKWRKGTNVLQCFRLRVLRIPTWPRPSPAENRRPTDMRRLFFILFAFALTFSSIALADDHTAASSISADDHGDPVLKAMLAELRRSQEKLQLGQLQRPYYIDYQVTSLQDYAADATLGALRSDQANIGRFVRVVVRIGDYKQDSYFGEGMGTVEVMPMDNNETALRHQLWLATDKAYKSALGGLTEKQAALRNVVVENDVPDFSQEKPADSVRDVAKLDVDLNKWKEVLRSTSNLFRVDPDLQSSDATLHFRLLNRFFVNTEGTVTRSGRAVYSLSFSGGTQAADGMRLDRSHGYTVTKPEELPTSEQIQKDVQKLIATFAELRKAPVVEDDYHGPVLFSSDAATAMFEQLIVRNIVGTRPDLGNPARKIGRAH